MIFDKFSSFKIVVQSSIKMAKKNRTSNFRGSFFKEQLNLQIQIIVDSVVEKFFSICSIFCVM